MEIVQKGLAPTAMNPLTMLKSVCGLASWSSLCASAPCCLSPCTHTITAGWQLLLSSQWVLQINQNPYPHDIFLRPLGSLTDSTVNIEHPPGSTGIDWGSLDLRLHLFWSMKDNRETCLDAWGMTWHVIWQLPLWRSKCQRLPCAASWQSPHALVRQPGAVHSSRSRDDSQGL